MRKLFHTLTHLGQCAQTAFHEGGFQLFSQRLRRWWDHQQARWFVSKAYQQWIAENDPTPADLENQRQWSATSAGIKVSLVCPLYRTPVSVLRETIESGTLQTYPHWELCLTLCEDESAALKNTVHELAKQDSRIRVIPLSENLGISGNTNAAIEASNGDWIGFLDHDDLLAPHALYEVAHYLEEHPACGLVYSDEDLLSPDGTIRRRPVLKPHWSPDMLLAFNYLCHFVVVRADYVRQVGGLRSVYNGAQDWDFLLRVTELTHQIGHIPKILYHWRELPTSTAASANNKPYVIEAQKAALRDCLERRKLKGEVKSARFGHYRIRWIFEEEPRVSIVIPSLNQPQHIRRLVEGILRETDYSNREIVVVDNGSTDQEVLDFYRQFDGDDAVRIVPYPEPFNYSAACNRGANAARGEYVLFLNNDMEVTHRDWLRELVGWGMQPGVGLVGGHLIYPDGSTQHAGLSLGLFGLVGHNFHHAAPETPSPFGLAEWLRNVTAVTGACQLIERDLFQRMGGFDESYELLYSDLELCLRIREQGLRVVFTPHCRLIHHECSTRPKREHPVDAERFLNRLRTAGIREDFYYHPLLSANSAVPQLKPKSARNTTQELSHLLGTAVSPFEKAIDRNAA